MISNPHIMLFTPSSIQVAINSEKITWVQNSCLIECEVIFPQHSNLSQKSVEPQIIGQKHLSFTDVNQFSQDNFTTCLLD